MATRVLAVSHLGTLTGDGVRWSTHLVLAEPMESGDVVTFASALPASARLLAHAPELSPALVERRDGSGAIVGLSAMRATGARVELELALLPRAGALLVAPLVDGDAVQRVTLVGGDEPRFEPASSLGLTRHVGFLSSPGIDEEARARCDRSLGEHGADGSLYVRTSSTLRDELPGLVTTRSERARGPAAAAFLVFALLVAALVASVRHLRRAAAVERAEADLESSFRDLADKERAAGESPAT